MKQKLKKLKKDITIEEKKGLEKAIQKMPEPQQILVNTCIMASKCKAKQRRYSIDWIFESLLIRIKHRSSYTHLRKREILPLPSEQTLDKYIEQLHCSVGFQKAIFKCLKFKAGRMEKCDKHGTLIFYFIISSKILLQIGTIYFFLKVSLSSRHKLGG